MATGEQRVRKTFHYKLRPTPQPHRTWATVAWRCRARSNAGRQERAAAWEQCRVSVTFAMQSAQLTAIKEVRPEYRELNAQVLQDVLHRLDKAFAAFFRRVKAGGHPGSPRLRGRDRAHRCTCPPVGAPGGAALDGGVLTLASSGCLRLRRHRPLQGTPRRSPSAARQTAGTPASRAPMYR